MPPAQEFGFQHTHFDGDRYLSQSTDGLCDFGLLLDSLPQAGTLFCFALVHSLCLRCFLICQLIPTYYLLNESMTSNFERNLPWKFYRWPIFEKIVIFVFEFGYCKGNYKKTWTKREIQGWAVIWSQLAWTVVTSQVAQPDCQLHLTIGKLDLHDSSSRAVTGVKTEPRWKEPGSCKVLHENRLLLYKRWQVLKWELFQWHRHDWGGGGKSTISSYI